MPGRRWFLGRLGTVGLGVAASQVLHSPKVFCRDAGGPPLHDLIALKGADPEVLFDTGIRAMGGMGRFVRPGQTVVVKPNIRWDAPPNRGATTNPRLVARVIAHCRDAGAKRVCVFDHACDEWRSAYRSSGIARAAKDAGAIVAPGSGHGYFHAVPVGGRHLGQVEEHELVLDSDVLINLPVLKHRDSVGLSASMKNLMGIVWDRGYWYRHDLHKCIADFAVYRRPNLNVIDASTVILRNGPRGLSEEDVVQMQTLLLSTDMVAADVAAARLLGRSANEIEYIRLAAAQGAGSMDLDRVSIKRIRLS